jgi:hypothetical protein
MKDSVYEYRKQRFIEEYKNFHDEMKNVEQSSIRPNLNETLL